MKKSEIYYMAMLSVIEDCRLESCTKLKIIERLMQDKQYAELLEKKETEEDKF